MTDTGFEVDLTNCDREPIHQLGAIQPFGFLVAVSADWMIARASANLADFAGIAAEEAIGLPLIDLIGNEAIHAIRNRLTLLRGPDAVERIFGLPLGGKFEGRFDCAVHLSGSTVILECEPNDQEAPNDTASLIRATMARLDQTSDLAGFLKEGARQVRALTGFDRVMVYRFGRDEAGEVVAEAVRPGIGSFLGLHYPASDIPRQARALYVRTPFRIIADVGATPVPIVPPRDETGAPIDLSLSVLRSVSPIHIEYLTNMGVGASLSISIIIGGKLWGLFACHHYAPLCPTFDRRTIAELFGQMFALKLESRERSETADFEMRARASGDRLLAAIASDATLLDQPDWIGDMLRETIPCDGIAIWLDGKMSQSGLTPPPAAIPAIVRRLNAMQSGRVYATDHLAELIPDAAEYAARAAGMLTIPISRNPRDYVMLFRQERIRSVTWAGDPHKPAQLGPHGSRLTPRQSFAEWSEEVRERAEPFSEVELRVAETLRTSLIEVVLRMSEDARAERHSAAERQEVLIAELNHRVRNILALIRGLVRQSRSPTASAADYIALLEGRIESLARAHDQITQDNWEPARLRALIETEAAAYLGERRTHLIVDGDPVLIRPSAFTTLALVIHELMTNSAKYGSLSDSGEVHVSWSRQDNGDLAIRWREHGGPPVQPPSRRGFGSTIIERSIPYDLGGQAETRFPPTGFEADFIIPARQVTDAPSAPEEATDAPAAPAFVNDEQPLLQGRALLVEDSLIIAMDAEDVLVKLGASSVSVASTVVEALAEVERGALSFAVLDVNLGSETSLPIAEKLLEIGVPFVMATGYGDRLNLPDKLRDVIVVQKPYSHGALSRAIEETLRG